MKNFLYHFPRGSSRKAAFTLIELLVVISIIVILAAMVFPIMNRVSVTQAKAVAKSQLFQMDTAIKAYQSKYGFYPPGNPAGAYTNTLYYELVGTLRTNVNGDPNGAVFYMPLDGSTTSQINSNDVWTLFRITGFANSAPTLRGTDERPGPSSFLKDIKSTQLGTIRFGAAQGTILVCSAGGEAPNSTGNSPWRYNSQNPTNNPGSYDLWVDVYLGSRTNRISNWSSDPQIVNL